MDELAELYKVRDEIMDSILSAECNAPIAYWQLLKVLDAIKEKKGDVLKVVTDENE